MSNFEQQVREEFEERFAGVSFRSHASDDIFSAWKRGKAVFRLHTGNAGEDDVLLADDAEEAKRDVLAHFEKEELPADWEIETICSASALQRKKGLG